MQVVEKEESTKKIAHAQGYACAIYFSHGNILYPTSNAYFGVAELSVCRLQRGRLWAHHQIHVRTQPVHFHEICSRNDTANIGIEAC